MAQSDTLAIYDALAARLPADDHASIDLRNGNVVLDFAEGEDKSVDYSGVLPSNYGGGELKAILTWAATTATSGAVLWGAAFERRSLDDASLGAFDLDSDALSDPVTGASAAPSEAGDLVQCELTLGAAETLLPHAGEPYRLRVSRLGTDAADTLAGDAELLAVELKEA
ncbi:hypothetical protein Mal64_13970 [Pseudobythopirellula maris]|uniref:Uncharacterized protein n=1 Tax=Pseudobythopirellula maris TaxID=2527991 RepID=A0A5C5ZVC4_9BACT|nr:hypothetical protein [Pseudobythopirellula maris]TWT90998.1 hypothetical protein Mal64_13970 [Pseudobythopirellula maris]